MGTVRWTGDADAVAQIATGSIDSVDAAPANNTFHVTVGNVTISAVGNTSVSQTAIDLVALLNASTDPLFSGITWTNPSAGNITATSDTAGLPFVAVLTETGAGTGAVTDFVDDTASAGPDHWTTAQNWDTGVVPVDADDVVIANSALPILYGLDQTAIELTSLTIKSTFTGTLGLPLRNALGYDEYRDRSLIITATTATIDGSGSGRINIQFDTDAISACIVNGSGTAAETGVPPILITGGHATGTLTLNKGTVGVAWYAGQTATLATISMGFISSQASDAVLTCGSGCTLTTLTKNGGAATINANITTVTQSSGTVTIGGAATCTTLTVQSGTAYYKSIGTVTTIIVSSGAVLDLRRDGRARVVTNCSVHAGASIYDPMATVTWTNDVGCIQCSLAEVTLDLGRNYTWTPTVI